jgi:hypothetical protein
MMLQNRSGLVDELYAAGSPRVLSVTSSPEAGSPDNR